MSRRSLYRQSRHTAQTAFINEIDDKIVHWTKEWTNPLLPNATAINTGPGITGTPSRSTGTPVPNLTDSSSALNVDSPNVNGGGVTSRQENGETASQYFGFTVKMWVATTDDSSTTNISVKDCDEDDLLDVAQLYPKRQEVKSEQTKTADSLTAADIRGAVGGEAIPGIVSYNTNDNPEEVAKVGEVNGTEPKVVEVTDTSVEVKGPETPNQVKPTDAEIETEDAKTEEVASTGPVIPSAVATSVDGDVEMIDETTRPKTSESENPVKTSVENTTEGEAAIGSTTEAATVTATETAALTATETATDATTGVASEAVTQTATQSATVNATPESDVIATEERSSDDSKIDINPADESSDVTQSITVPTDSAAVLSTAEVIDIVTSDSNSVVPQDEDVSMEDVPPS